MASHPHMQAARPAAPAAAGDAERPRPAPRRAAPRAASTHPFGRSWPPASWMSTSCPRRPSKLWVGGAAGAGAPGVWDPSSSARRRSPAMQPPCVSCVRAPCRLPHRVAPHRGAEPAAPHGQLVRGARGKELAGAGGHSSLRLQRRTVPRRRSSDRHARRPAAATAPLTIAGAAAPQGAHALPGRLVNFNTQENFSRADAKGQMREVGAFLRSPPCGVARGRVNEGSGLHFGSVWPAEAPVGSAPQAEVAFACDG
jgi:hypothetical protein